MRQVMKMLQVISQQQQPRTGFKSVPEPQIEIKEMGDTGSLMSTSQVKPIVKLGDDDDEEDC